MVCSSLHVSDRETVPPQRAAAVRQLYRLRLRQVDGGDQALRGAPGHRVRTAQQAAVLHDREPAPAQAPPSKVLPQEQEFVERSPRGRG